MGTLWSAPIYEVAGLLMFLVLPIQSWGLAHVSIYTTMKWKAAFPSSPYISDSYGIFLILSHHYFYQLVKGGIGKTIGITGIGLSKVGGGFHKVNGVTIGPNRKFVFPSFKYLYITTQKISIFNLYQNYQWTMVFLSNRMIIPSLTTSSQSPDLVCKL